MCDAEADNVRFMAGILCIVVGRTVQPSCFVGFNSLMCMAGLCVCTGQAQSCKHERKLGIVSVAFNCLFVVGLYSLAKTALSRLLGCVLAPAKRKLRKNGSESV